MYACRNNHTSGTIQSEPSQLTLLNTGVQLGDLYSQTVYAVLEGIGAPIKSVGLIEKFPKNIFCMLTCKKGRRDFLCVILLLCISELSTITFHALSCICLYM